MIANCAVYEGGQRRAGELPLQQAGAAAREDGAFVWLGLVEPSAEELAEIATQFDLHELAVEDAVNAHQRPKVELYGETLLVVVKTARYVDPDEVIELGELLLFVNPTFIVSVRHGEGDLSGVRERIDARPDLLTHGVGMVLYAILDHVVDGYEEAAAGVDVDIQEVEREVFSGDRANPVERIYKLEREVLDFQRAVAPLAAEVEQIFRGHYEVVPDGLHEYFRDVHDHLRRVGGQIAGFRQLLDSALNANLTQVSVRQNEDMRKISAWVAIIAVPTAVAGIYGMNFRHMPELDFQFGYPAVLVFIAVVCLVLYRRFKRAGWL
ncbi:MAG TPA: magnesium and cobalt transport protein CorA [Solirubrobacterales bacterium]|jgi:magnesium transporter|nr:magnesium and cobalt transport protein CorA [Solirubrobacterales bacterium]